MRALSDLARAGNFPSVASNVLAALLLTQIDPTSGVLIAGAIIAGCLAYAGGSTFNDIFDAGFDARHRPDRAIPTGVIPLRPAIAIGLFELALASIGFVLLGASVPMTLGMVATILVYDWIHKRWAGSVLLMAACRLLLALTVATLPGHAFTRLFLGWAGAVYVYIVLISVLARMEYRAGGKYSKSTQGGPDAGPREYPIGKLLMFIPLFDAAALLVAQQWLPALLCAAAIPLGSWAQRRAAAT